ncbi:hypothetical protein, partial [Paraclostridium bifermentans]
MCNYKTIMSRIEKDINYLECLSKENIEYKHNYFIKRKGEGNECLINVLYDLKYLYRKMNEEECVNKRVFTWIERVYYNLFFWIDQY